MIFNEIYGAYYSTVAKLIKAASENALNEQKMREIIKENAFSESLAVIESALKEERWQLIRSDGITPIKNPPDLPMTLLLQRWIKAVCLDPRIRLFGYEDPLSDEIEPLFTSEDIFLYDQYADGDDYTSEEYITIFRTILSAIKDKKPLFITTENKKGNLMDLTVMPERLEYSEKDDKFRLITSGCRKAEIINLARIKECRPCDGEIMLTSDKPKKRKKYVILEVYDGRNALERIMLHFSDCEKEAERIDRNHYKLKISYYQQDETELIIRVLSFGPMVKVTAPERFRNIIKGRLRKQKSCEL